MVKPPRFLPTMALAVLWVALYFLWLAVRPTDPADPTAPVRPAPLSTTTSTAPSPSSTFKP